MIIQKAALSSRLGRWVLAVGVVPGRLFFCISANYFLAFSPAFRPFCTVCGIKIKDWLELPLQMFRYR